MELKHQHFAELFRSDYYTVSVNFEENLRERLPASQFGMRAGYPTIEGVKDYTYKVPKTTKISPGDRLVVLTDNRAGTLKTVIVRTIHVEQEIHEKNGFDYKWIVGKYDDIMADHIRNVEKDNKLKVAVGKLDAALSRVSLRKRIADAMEVLDPETKQELLEAFGADVLPQVGKE